MAARVSSPWAAFLAAMQAMGAVADEVAFIDDRQDNISAAADLGMHTVLHRDNDSTVARLDELVGRTSQQPTSGSVES